MSNIIDSIQLSGTVYTLSAETSGTTYTAGRGIDIDSGNTVSISLPISAGTGINSIAEGRDTTASGHYAHAEGLRTTASGLISHAECMDTTASGHYAHAEGSATTAIGMSSHAEGNGTKASGFSSHAEGRGTIANNDSEHASGQWNISSSASTTFGDSGNTLFSVGNGTADSARHNAFEIRQNGDIYLSSGGTDIKLQDYLGGGGGNPTVELTQAEYDALVSAGTVSADTYYIITDASPIDVSTFVTSGQMTSAITQATSGKVNTSSVVSSVTSASTDNEIPTAKAVFDAIPTGGTSITIDPTLDSGSTNPVSNSAITISLNNKASKSLAYGSYSFGETNNAPWIRFKSVSSNNLGREIYYAKINNKGILSTNDTWARNNLNFSLVETSAITTSITSGSTDSQVPSAKAVYDALGQGGGTASSAITSGDTNAVAGGAVYTKFDEVETVTARALNGLAEADEVTARALIDVNEKFGGLKLVQITQSAYDALTTKDPSTLYIITNVVN